ncbi:hypothetical protein PMAYCL1PPCAC_08019, partial [Pristionchus mayeri]
DSARDEVETGSGSVEERDRSPSVSRTLCIICLEKSPNILFYDCKHLAMCEDCLEASQANSMTSCPKCR